MKQVKTSLMAAVCAFAIAGSSWAGNPWENLEVRFLPAALFDINNDGEVYYNVDAQVIVALWGAGQTSLDADIASPSSPSGIANAPDGVVNGVDLTSLREFEGHFDVTGNVALVYGGLNDNRVNVDDVLTILDYVDQITNGGTIDPIKEVIMDVDLSAPANPDPTVTYVTAADANLLMSRLGLSPWKNFTNNFDVNADGVVTAADRNVLSNYIYTDGFSPLAGVISKLEGPFLDVNGDKQYTSADVLMWDNNN